MVPVFSEHEFVEAWPADKGGGPNIPFKPEFSHLAKFQTPQEDWLRTRVRPERCAHRVITGFHLTHWHIGVLAPEELLSAEGSNLFPRTASHGVFAANWRGPRGELCTTATSAGERQTDRLSDARR